VGCPRPRPGNPRVDSKGRLQRRPALAVTRADQRIWSDTGRAPLWQHHRDAPGREKQEAFRGDCGVAWHSAAELLPNQRNSKCWR
jgi:hypothetical protein